MFINSEDSFRNVKHLLPSSKKSVRGFGCGTIIKDRKVVWISNLRY